MTLLTQLLPHEARWEEISELAEAILKARIAGPEGAQSVVLFPLCAGGGYELGAVLGSLPGSSATLLGNSILNDQDWSHSKLSQPFEQSCSPEFAEAMAAANFLEIQRTKGDAFNVERIIGLGITATIATTNPEAGLRGGQRAYISLRRHDGMRSIAVRFQHSSEYEGEQREKRKLQSQIIDLLALNLIAESLGLAQLPLTEDYRLQVETGTRVEVDGGFLLESKPVGVWECDSDFAVLGISAQGALLDPGFLRPGQHTLIPCSANPFTPAHDEMALHIAANGKTPVFVINTENAEKGSVETAEVLRRARAFVGRWPVLITHGMGEFVEMAEQFSCDFAVGADTAVRIFLPRYCEAHGGLLNVYARLKASGVNFTVFPRLDTNDRLRTERDVPAQFSDLFQTAPDIISRVSSTAIRASSSS